MKLDETLQLLALQIPVDPDALIQFAAEDTVGGWDLNQGGWPIGSLWGVEGKVLYALTRLLRPDLVVEVGTHRGCSTTHFATALDVNDNGLIVTLDTAPGVGDMIPSRLDKRVNKVAASGVDWLAEQADESIDIIYEDADHSTETSRDVAHLARIKLKPGGLLIVHDAAHDYAWVGDGAQITSDVGATIRRGLEIALDNAFRVYRTDPSDCGFALWQKPGFAKDIHSTEEKPKNDFVAADGTRLEVIDDAQNPALANAIANLRANEPAAQPALDEAHAYEEARIEAETPADEPAPQKAFNEMNRDELVAYAEAHGIDLTGARTNVDRVAKITEAQSGKNA